MRAYLPPGSDHRLGQNGKPSLTLESSDKHRIFRRVIILIETARRLTAAYNWTRQVPILALETTTLEAFVRMMHGIYEKGTPHATE